jgi:DNA modification methylase
MHAGLVGVRRLMAIPSRSFVATIAIGKMVSGLTAEVLPLEPHGCARTRLVARNSFDTRCSPETTKREGSKMKMHRLRDSAAVVPRVVVLPCYASKIVQLPIHSLRPYANNGRTHSKRQIKQIFESIKRFGFVNPVLIDESGQIIAGHGRVKAAEQLGLRRIPTIALEHLSEAEKRAYIIADNRLAEKAGWDREILAIELQGLIDLDFDVELTGFDMGEIDLILDEAAEAGEAHSQPEDDAPDVAPGPATTQVSDLWILGKHRLFCGDARDAHAYTTVLDGQLAEFACVDPPYNVRIEGNVSGLGRVKHRNFSMACGEMDERQFTDFLRAAFHLMATHTLNGAIHCIFMDWRHTFEMLTAGRAVYHELKNICVWHKTNAGMGSQYRSQHEFVFVWKKGSGPHVNNIELGRYGRSRSNVWSYAGVNTLRPGRLDELAMHPTVKPVALVADAIKDCSRRGGRVLDPFAGSGTTVIAAEKTGRQARAIEIDPYYCDVAIRRWQAYTGKNAVHADTGQFFEDHEARNRAPDRRRKRGDT